MSKEIQLEEAFSQLEDVIAKMQSGELTLEQSFQKYEEGMKLIQSCHSAIDKVEKKLQVIEGVEE